LRVRGGVGISFRETFRRVQPPKEPPLPRGEEKTPEIPRERGGDVVLHEKKERVVVLFER